MHIRVVESKNEIAECFRLRAEVFVDEQNVSEAEERDGLDDQCVHFLASDADRAIGAARLNYLSSDYAKVQRVCVVKRARGRGVGEAIIRAMIAQVRSDSLRETIRLGSQLHALEFYRKLGFREFGDIYLDARIEHREMEFRL